MTNLSRENIVNQLMSSQKNTDHLEELNRRTRQRRRRHQQQNDKRNLQNKIWSFINIVMVLIVIGAIIYGVRVSSNAQTEQTGYAVSVNKMLDYEQAFADNNPNSAIGFNKMDNAEGLNGLISTQYSTGGTVPVVIMEFDTSQHANAAIKTYGADIHSYQHNNLVLTADQSIPTEYVNFLSRD